VNAADRTVTGAVVFMYAAIPLYGTFAVFDPLRAPMPVIVPGAFSIGVAFAMLVAAAICVWGAVRRPVPRRFAIAQVLPGSAIVIGALFGFDPGTGLKLGVIVLAMGAVGIATYGYSALPGVTRAIVIGVLASGTLAALTAFVMLVTHTPAALYAYDNGRATGIFLNPNELAAFLLVVLGLAAGVAASARSGPLRVLAGVTLVAALTTFAATYSRWGFAAAACGAVFYALVAGGRRAWLGLAAIVLAVVVLLLGPGQALHHNPRDDSARFVAWTTGARTWLAFPLTGIGPLAFRRIYDVVRPPEAPDGNAPVAFDPHSLPLAYAAEDGLVGLCAMLAAWAIYVREIPRALRGAKSRRITLACAFAAGLVALNVHVLLNTISLYFPLATQGVALMLALAQRDLDATAA
jgi:hypothetical protein